jgi:hypothetical protein
MNSIFTLMVLLLPLISAAQDYQCIVPGQKGYFINRIGYLKGIDTDSVKMSGGNTVIYPYHSPRGDYKDHVFNNFPKEGGNWLGKTITIAADGTTSFENYWGGTLMIRTQATLNESWNLYTDATDTFYTATITAIDTMSFMNVQDSVKRIAIQAHNSSGPLTTDPLHNAEIILSKQHGFVQVCDLYMFPLHEPGKEYQKGFDYLHDISSRENTAIFFTQFNFHNPSELEIFDYNVGDRFLRSYYGTSEMKVLAIVSDKQVISPSEIRYKISTWQEKLKPFSFDKETTGYLADLTVEHRPLFNNTYMPEQWGVSKYFLISTDNLNCIDTTYSTCSYGQCGEGQYYKKGLGQVQYSYCQDPTPGNQLYVILQSWEKGNEKCGYYPATLNITISSTENSISVYPNPANNYVDITCPTPTSNNVIKLRGMDGKLITENKFGGNSQRLDLSTVHNGVYMITLEHNSTVTHSKLIIQH